MFTTRLRKVGGSVMLAVPPALLEMLQLEAGAAVGLAVDGGRLVMESKKRPRYSLEELLAISDYDVLRDQPDRDWTGGPATGAEEV